MLFTHRDNSRLAVLAVFVTLAIFGCVLLHELGHALMARVFGIGTRDITLYPIGGVARLERMPENPGAEIAIALAGPAVNVVIAGLLWLGLTFGGLIPSIEMLFQGSLGHVFLMNLLIANIALVVFNMVPAFPMDGGRVLRAILTMFSDRLRATEIAANVGLVFAALFVLGGLFGGQISLMLVGMFVMFAGQQERHYVRMKDYQQRVTHWMGPTVTVESANSAQANGRQTHFVWDAQRQAWVVWYADQPVSANSINDTAHLSR